MIEVLLIAGGLVKVQSPGGPVQQVPRVAVVALGTALVCRAHPAVIALVSIMPVGRGLVQFVPALLGKRMANGSSTGWALRALA